MDPQENGCLLLPVEHIIPKSPRYVSIHHPRVLQEIKARKQPMRTMGPLAVELPNPLIYLKKHSKEPKLPPVPQVPEGTPKYNSYIERLMVLPPRRENLTRRIIEEKEFKKTTALPKETTVLPRKLQLTRVDTRKGHSELLEYSGLVPKYLHKKGYGESPYYVKKYHMDNQRAMENQEKRIREYEEQMTANYENAILWLKDLKKEWNTLFEEYSRLPLVIDLISQKARKLKLEAEMDRLHNNIKFVEKSLAIDSYN